MLIDKARNISINVLILVADLGRFTNPRKSHMSNDEISIGIIHRYIVNVEGLSISQLSVANRCQAISSMENNWLVILLNNTENVPNSIRIGSEMFITSIEFECHRTLIQSV